MEEEEFIDAHAYIVMNPAPNSMEQPFFGKILETYLFCLQTGEKRVIHRNFIEQNTV